LGCQSSPLECISAFLIAVKPDTKDFFSIDFADGHLWTSTFKINYVALFKIRHDLASFRSTIEFMMDNTGLMSRPVTKD
jgi:hypothetical protein